MDNSLIFMIILQLFLIMLNAIFACAEIAIISMNENKLEKLACNGDKRAIRLQKLTNQPARFLATIQVAITLSGFMGSAFAAENFSEVLVSLFVGLGVPISEEILDSISVVLITIILSYFTLVFGELVPKQIGMRKAETLGLALSGLISIVSKMFKPLVSFLTISTNGVLRLMGIDPNVQDDEVSEEEIRMMIEVGNKKGTIANEEKEFIQNVFDFDNISVENIITHRTDVVMLDMEDSDDAWAKTIADTRYTYYPICDGTPDHIRGVLNTKEYFRLNDKSRESVMKKAVTPAYFVPETLKADILFKNMKKERVQFAVVLDEYGGISGIITIKNLVEELVGELEDEEVYEDSVHKIGEGVWKIEGSVLLEDLTSVLEIPLESEEYDTLNGMIFHKLGCLPEPKTEIEIDNLLIKVIAIQDNQVKYAIVRKKETKDAVDNNDCK